MNYYFFISGILMIVMAVAHSVIGEIRILIPMKNWEGITTVRGSIRNTKLTLRFAWHITSVLGAWIAVVLIYYANISSLNPDHIFVLKTLAITFFVSFLVSIIGSRAQHPSWIIFLVVSILTWLGL
jgi:hypothetical protein